MGVSAAFMAFAGFHSFMTKSAIAGGLKMATVNAYGPLVPDPDGVLDLPAGFKYKIFSRTGDEMDDGLLVPTRHDGMAAFEGPDGKTILVRNHENVSGDGAFGPNRSRLSLIPTNKIYDYPNVTPGGTVTLVYDTKTGTLEKQFLSLAGSLYNCAGGPTPWGSWISCEETTADRHGYCFEVPATTEIGLADPVPLRAMGRFNHEAIAVEPESGVVYETEDQDDGLLYRFIPTTPGKLAEGGRLQALRIKGKSGVHTGKDFPKQEPMEVDWVDLDNVETSNLRKQGADKGAAKFARNEGIWYDNNVVYIMASGGGSNGKGQMWKYFPSPFEGTAGESAQPGKLELFVEPNDINKLNMGDNITLASWGDLIVCEDGGGNNFLRSIDPDGNISSLAKNALSSSEFTGATFSPDGSTLFVNIQTPGLTLAITGPWPVPVTSLRNEVGKAGVSQFQLLPNHPNPFASEPRIPFALGKDAKVLLEIFNAEGSLVMRWDLGHKRMGNHHVVWNAQDMWKRPVGNGVYFVHMLAGGYVSHRRLLVSGR